MWPQEFGLCPEDDENPLKGFKPLTNKRFTLQKDSSWYSFEDVLKGNDLGITEATCTIAIVVQVGDYLRCYLFF